MCANCAVTMRFQLSDLHALSDRHARHLAAFISAIIADLLAAEPAPRIRSCAERAVAAVSSGADWGNVRYGKGFRTQVALEAIARHADLNSNIALLDVGSNRASFAHRFLETARRTPPSRCRRNPGRTCRALRARPSAHRATDHRPHRERAARDRPVRASSTPATRSNIWRIPRMCWPITGARAERRRSADPRRAEYGDSGLIRHRRRMVHRQAPLSFLRPNAGADDRRKRDSGRSSKGQISADRFGNLFFVARREANTARHQPRG